jgi:N-acetylglucosamine kinase
LQICADIGGSFIDIAVVDDNTQIVRRHKTPTPVDDWSSFVGVFAEAQERYGALVGAATPLSIAMAGLIDPDDGRLVSANILCAHGRLFARELGAALERPVLVTNDANAFVLAEALLGAARGHARVFGIILGTGVGGGLIENGRILTGPSGISGEWGHGPIIHQSPLAPGSSPLFTCGCGRQGCLDTLGGARGLERLHGFLHHDERTSHEITAGWIAGDPACGATVEYYVGLLSGPVAMLLNTFPATIVPVGGGLANVPELITLLDSRIRDGMLRQTEVPVLVPASLGDKAGVLGAALAWSISEKAHQPVE